MDKSLQFLSFMVLLYEGFYIEHILLAKKIGQNFFRILLAISVFGTNPLPELVLAYSLLEPWGQISIRAEKKRIIRTLK